MEQKDVAQLFVNAVGKVEFYWNFYVVTLVALTGWMVSSKIPLTADLRLLVTGGYVVFVGMNLMGLWGSYSFAEALRQDLLALPSEPPGKLSQTRTVLSGRSFATQRWMALLIHVVLAVPVLWAVWHGRS